jgi:hypothetical protein
MRRRAHEEAERGPLGQGGRETAERERGWARLVDPMDEADAEAIGERRARRS